jgi:hypothetical protein
MSGNMMNKQDEQLKQAILNGQSPELSQDFVQSTIKKILPQTTINQSRSSASVLVLGHSFSYKQIAFLVMAIAASLVLTQQYLGYQEDDLTRVDALSMTTLLSL